MLTVLDEALRIYPPSPTGLLRVVPKGGDYICGKWIHGGVGFLLKHDMYIAL
jgi:hypothetical protein